MDSQAPPARGLFDEFRRLAFDGTAQARPRYDTIRTKLPKIGAGCGSTYAE